MVHYRVLLSLQAVIMSLRSILTKIPFVVATYRFSFRVFYTLYTRAKSAWIKVGQHEVNLGHDVGQKKGYLDPHYFDFYNQIIADYVQDGDIVFDIGAHVGVTAIMLSDAVGTKGMVYAFEPFPTNFSILESNISHNSIANIRPIQLAVSVESGTVDFFVNKIHTGYNSISYENAVDYLKSSKDVKSVRVESTTLDDFTSEYQVSPSFIKLDCQGAEFEILKGAKSFLRSVENVFIYLEFWPMAIENVSNVSGEQFLYFLEELGMQIIFSEDYNDLISEKNKFVAEVEKMERGYTNLMLQKRCP